MVKWKDRNKSRQQASFNPAPPQSQDQNLQRLAVQLLNTTGKLSDTDLNSFGYVSPIVKQLLASGYKQDIGSLNQPAPWSKDAPLYSGLMSDKDALDWSIKHLRKGYPLGKGPDPSMWSMSQNAPGMKPNTASGNLVTSLMDKYSGSGNPVEMKKAVEQDLRATLGAERQVLHTPNVGAKEAYPAAQQAAIGKSLGMAPGIDPRYKIAEIQGFSDPKNPIGRADLTHSPQKLGNPDTLARSMAVKDYMDRGTSDINNYNQVAGLFGGLVPAEVQPLYQAMVDQRGQTMLRNLALWKDKVGYEPTVQKLKNRATDLAKQASGGKAGLINAALSAKGYTLPGQGPMQIPGLSQAPQGGGGANPSDLALSRQITNNLNLAKFMGNQFSQWENPVISRNQIGMLNNFLPKTKKADTQSGPLAAYFASRFG